MGWIEDGKQTEEMAYSIYGNSGKWDVIMSIVTSLYVDAWVVFGGGLYGRKVSDKSDRIGIAEYLGHTLYPAQIDFRHSSQGIPYGRSVFAADEDGTVNLIIQRICLCRTLRLG